MRTSTVVVNTTDDLDGTPDAQTYFFGWDNHTYEIDLGELNAKRLKEALAPYLDVGRPVTRKRGNTTKRTPAPKPATEHPPTAPDAEQPDPERPARPIAGTSGKDIRQWWADNPDDLPTWQARGAIPSAVVRAYQEQHPA